MKKLTLAIECNSYHGNAARKNETFDDAGRAMKPPLLCGHSHQDRDYTYTNPNSIISH